MLGAAHVAAALGMRKDKNVNFVNVSARARAVSLPPLVEGLCLS